VYGYIRKGEKFTASKEPLKDTYTISQFKEKPDLNTAKMYLESGDYWWNSGMFAFKTDFVLNEIEKHEPSLYGAFTNLASSPMFSIGQKDAIHYLQSWPALDHSYALTPSLSIDIALAEKTKFASVVKASFSWDDVGSWDSFETLFSSHHGSAIEIQSSNNFVYSDIPVALCGVQDLIVVVKNNKVLVLKKGKSELVKEIVKLSKAEDQK
jgi:mannose-1-phosphate guanylyltransferase